MNSFWSSFISGILSGILATGVYAFLAYIGKRLRDRNLYEKYVGTYLAFPKTPVMTPKDMGAEVTSQPVYGVSLRRKSNKFLVSGISAFGNPDLSGEILMSTQSRMRGSGYYRHLKDPKGIVRYGFMEVQLADEEILVHMEAQRNGTVVIDGYRWERVDTLTSLRDIQEQNFTKKWPASDPSQYRI